MSSPELLDSWHATAASGSKTLLKKLSVEFTLICKFRMLMKQMTHQIGDLGKLLCAELTVMSQSAFHFNISKYQVNASRTQMFNNVCITITCPRSSGIELRAMTIDDMLPKGLLRATMCTSHLISQAHVQESNHGTEIDATWSGVSSIAVDRPQQTGTRSR